MINLWPILFEHAPHLFDTGEEHGPWLSGDTRKVHGPVYYGSMTAYLLHVECMKALRNLEKEMFK